MPGRVGTGFAPDGGGVNEGGMDLRAAPRVENLSRTDTKKPVKLAEETLGVSMHRIFFVAAAVCAALTGAASAQAPGEGYYALTLGVSNIADKEITGRLKAPFVTGEGGGIPSGVNLPVDTVYEFDTDYDPGVFVGLTMGKASNYGPFRSELEISYSRNSVNGHSDITLLGEDVSGDDLALFTGAETPTGTTVGQVFADGRGRLITYTAMLNFFWDIPVPAERVRPFVGIGGGASIIDVDFGPSGVDIVSHQDTVLAYQAIVGASYQISDKLTLSTAFRMRDTSEAEFATDREFLDSELKFDTTQANLEITLRRMF
ncbi:MAG: P44/Msp2 family outer membrane protein [Pseudomonadota bacterium]